MNVEFHYYVTGYLAKKAGFSSEEATIIAYSCQFVDSNINIYKIINDSGTDYQTIATQNYGWWRQNAFRDIYLPFHFFPGGSEDLLSNRLDGRQNPWNCKANSRPAKDLFISALKSKNLYRIGIAAHTFADTFAHQNFSAFEENWNNTGAGSAYPAIGHAQAKRNPDTMFHRWNDNRLKDEEQKIDNQFRFAEAAKKIFRYFSLNRRGHFDDTDIVSADLKKLWNQHERINKMSDRILDYLIETSIPAFDVNEWRNAAYVMQRDSENGNRGEGYDTLIWLKDVITYSTERGKIRTRTGKKNFFESHLYRWMEAAQAHKREALKIIQRYCPPLP